MFFKTSSFWWSFLFCYDRIVARGDKMKQDKMHLINKIFNNETIRTVWDKDDEKWIAKRLKGIQDRKELTDVWQENGIIEGKEYAILTNEIYKEWSGMTAKEYKQYKGLRKESLRDNMDNIE